MLQFPRKTLFGFAILLLSFQAGSCFEFEAPQFIEEPPSHVQFLSDVGLILNCTATGRPTPLVQWHCSIGTPCSTISGLRLLHDTSLSLLPFAPEAYRPDIHGTTYRCVAGNQFGTLVKDVVVKSHVRSSRVEVKVPSTTGVRDSPALLECQYPAEVGFLKSWIRDEQYLIFPNEPNDKYLILPNGDLLLWQVSSQDFYSKFQCRVHGKYGEEEYLSSEGQIKPANAEELGRPSIAHFPPPVVTVEQGQVVTLPCLAYGNPKPIVQWYRKVGTGGPFLPLSSSSSNSFEEFRGEAESGSGNNIQIRHGVLLISNAKRLHSTTYACNATNSLGSEQRQVDLLITSPLQLNLAPSVLTVDLGKPAEFTCTSTDETAELSWVKDGVQLSLGTFSSRLRLFKNKLQISRVVKEDQGVYQCLGSNSGGRSQQKSASLHLGDLKPILLYTFIDQTVLPGTVISVRCKGTGWPLPTVTWLLDGFDLPTTERFMVDHFVVDDIVTSYINITSVTTADAGEYTCSFRNGAGEVSHSNRINVYGDLLVRPMPEVIAIFGKSFRLKCPVGGYPVDTVTWAKGNTRLPKSVHQKVLAEGVLVFENVVKADAGTYQCTARRQSQTVDGTIEVKVVVQPSITPFQFGQPVVGDRVSVLCSLTTDLSNISIQWEKDKNVLSQSGVSHRSRYGQQGYRITPIDEFTSSLSMSSLSSEQDGNYTCRMSSGTYPHIAATWTSTLVVNAPPRITKFIFEENIVEGMKVQALCFSQGDLPLRFQWFRNNSPLLVPDGGATGFEITSFGENSEILTIESVEVGMGGEISCQVSNRAGKGIHSAQLVIKVPPKFVIEPKDVSASVGTLLRLRCAAEGRPEPKVKWLQEVGGGHESYRDVDSLPGIRHVNGTLTFSHLSKDHAGAFVCQAGNDVGSPINKRIQISVNAPPRVRPRAGNEIAEIGQEVTLRCVVDGDSPITVSWKFNGQDVTQAQRLNGSVATLTIRNVGSTERGDYTCMALNSFGHDYSVISLLVQEQPQSPLNLRVLEQSSRSVTLAWSIVAYKDVYILAFILRYQQGNENWTTEVVGGGESRTTIKSLLPFTTYTFTISARNQIGTSKPSEILTVRTDEEEPSAPRHLSVEEIQGVVNALRVSWVRPEFPNGLITHFTVFYQENSEGYERLGGGRGKYRNVPPSRSSLILRVESAIQYSILVRAANGAGFGSNSTMIQIQTRDGLPKYPPAEVRCQGLSAKSLQISWKTPRAPSNGIILGFRLNVHLIQTSDDDVRTNSNLDLESEVTGSSTVVQGLREMSQYSVQVAAFTSGGTGPPSRPQFCSTKESFPGIPSQMKVVELPGYVILAWAYTPKEAESLRKFHIYVRTRGDGQVLKKSVPPNTRKYELRHLGRDQIYEACVTAENLIGEGNPSHPVSFKVPRPDAQLEVPPTILSFGQRIWIPWKADVDLECQYTATKSSVEIIWKRNSITLPEYKESTLHLQNIKSQESGNYTCILTDGTHVDQITHTLLVQVPPDPPVVHVRRHSANGSTILSWKLTTATTSSPVLGFSLNHRPLDGEWEEEVNLDKKRSYYEFRLDPTQCFSKTFEVFLTAYNAIGTSLPSETVRIDVEGSFTFPPETATISSNATSITFNFSAWNLFECDNTQLTIEYRPSGESQWILWSLNNWTDGVVLSNLTPEKEYDVRLRVESGGGGERSQLTREFKIQLSQNSFLNHQGNLGGLYRDAAVVVIPLAFAVVGISSAVTGTLIIWWRRRKELKRRQNLPLASFPVVHNKGERDYTIIRGEKQFNESDCIPETGDDIHPYATFHMHPNQRFGYNPSHCHEIYDHRNHSELAPQEEEYGYRYEQRHPVRERDYDFGNPNPRSFCENPPLEAEKRKSLPRSRHGRYPPQSQSYPSRHVEEMEPNEPGSCRLRSDDVGPGANSGARRVKRRKRDEEGYICPHDHKFINV